jgi:hypothetical protein
MRIVMSIDFYLDLHRPVFLRTLLPEVGRVLTEMLGLSSSPDLTLDVLENGQRKPAVTDELRDRSTPMFLISIAGEDETVALLATTSVSVEMGAMRSPLEYLLGAAVAIALARELGGTIGDDWHVFGDETQKSQEELLRRLKVSRKGLSPHEAAALVISKWPKLTTEDQ